MVSRMRWFSFLLAFAFILATGACRTQEAAESKTAAGFGEQTWPYLTTTAVKVRSGPGTQYNVIAEIKSGTKVNVASREGEWLKIVSKQGNPPGYIHERYARPTAEPVKQRAAFVAGPYTATTDTLVREGPGLHYKSVAKITKGMKVHVVDAEGDWLKVQSKHGNPPGYIEKKSAQRSPAN
ncbi:MAG: SH3 domain-containing protein [Deltaproteobacteria bacterium]|nr:SH3 domain-containing protein [Deltaproteobacteria bacterium]